MQTATDEGRTTNLVYFVFDLLFLDGNSLNGLPLLARKERTNAAIECPAAFLDAPKSPRDYHLAMEEGIRANHVSMPIR
jgi:ATP-dependent DNA ligase